MALEVTYLSRIAIGYYLVHAVEQVTQHGLDQAKNSVRHAVVRDARIVVPSESSLMEANQRRSPAKAK